MVKERRNVTRTAGGWWRGAATVAGILSAAGLCAAAGGPGTGRAPEGNVGIASRYVEDGGIREDPDVIFSDNFEEVDEYAPNVNWDEGYANGGRMRAADKPGEFHSGKKALELTVIRPSAQKEVGSTVVKYVLDGGAEELFLRYYAKFGKDSEFWHGGAHNGGGMDAIGRGTPAASPGVRADGRNKFTVFLDTWRDRASVASPGYLVTYVYHPEQRHNFGEQWYPSGKIQPAGGPSFFGRGFVARRNGVPQRDRWYCFELMVKANTPGQRDGHVAFWVDGVLAADFGNLRLRDVPELKINRVTLTVYSMNEKVTAPLTIFYDDVVIARSYVGPMMAAKVEKEPGKLVPPAGWAPPPAAGK